MRVSHVACLLLACCTSNTWREPVSTSVREPAVQRVCIDVSDDQLPDVKEAIGAWNHALQRWMTFEAVTDDKGTCDYTIQETVQVCLFDHNALAWTSSVGGRSIYLTSGRYEVATTAVVVHELGHAFGAQHIAGTTMSKEYHANARCPDMVTVAQVAAWNHVDIGLVSWCM